MSEQIDFPLSERNQRVSLLGMFRLHKFQDRHCESCEYCIRLMKRIKAAEKSGNEELQNNLALNRMVHIIKYLHPEYEPYEGTRTEQIVHVHLYAGQHNAQVS